MNTIKLLTAVAASALLAQPASARMLDPNVPEDAVEITKRVQCPADGQDTVVYEFSGNIYSRVRGQRDKLLFKAVGMNVRRCAEVTDPQRGTGYRLTSREILLYLDPETGEVLRNWENPWTGETVEVIHIANDPVNSRPFYPYAADGTPFTLDTMRFQGDWALWKSEIPLWYPNPLAGDYQEYIGGTYHSMEVFDFAMRKERLLDTANYATAYPSISWVRLSRWMPWMKMEDANGTIVFNAMGTKLENGLEGLPQVMLDEIALNYPEYVTAPPADDSRPNATTWTVTKAWIDARREAEAQKATAAGHSQ